MRRASGEADAEADGEAAEGEGEGEADAAEDGTGECECFEDREAGIWSFETVRRVLAPPLLLLSPKVDETELRLPPPLPLSPLLPCGRGEREGRDEAVLPSRCDDSRCVCVCVCACEEAGDAAEAAAKLSLLLLCVMRADPAPMSTDRLLLCRPAVTDPDPDPDDADSAAAAFSDVPAPPPLDPPAAAPPDVRDRDRAEECSTGAGGLGDGEGDAAAAGFGDGGGEMRCAYDAGDGEAPGPSIAPAPGTGDGGRRESLQPEGREGRGARVTVVVASLQVVWRVCVSVVRCALRCARCVVGGLRWRNADGEI